MNIPITPVSLGRLAAITVGSFILAFAVPSTGQIDSSGASIATAIFAATLVSFLIFQAAERRRMLLMTVSLELNKLRRIYHLSKNLSEASQRFRGWFTEIHLFLTEYLSVFAQKKFSDYDDGSAAFRKLSYHIYTVPELETKKEGTLFEDLLKTTGVIAEARQQIREMQGSRLSAYSWASVLLIVSGVVITQVLTLGDSTVSRLLAAVTIATALLAVEMLWEVDALRAEEDSLSKRYVDNIGKLELSRRR
ncbi:MAG: hypothetical protein AAB692_05720 [Patescibacteria group bacterium]